MCSLLVALKEGDFDLSSILSALSVVVLEPSRFPETSISIPAVVAMEFEVPNSRDVAISSPLGRTRSISLAEATFLALLLGAASLVSTSESAPPAVSS